MNRCATSKIQAPHLVTPSAGVPSPAGDRVINNSCPDEHEDDTGQHAAALGDGSGGESDGNGAEHALVDGEEQIREARRADGWTGEDVLEAKVGQVANKGPSGM